jgi:NADH-quinone oxidoreductase subunit E
MTPATATACETARKFKSVCEILERHDRSPARMVPILQDIQKEYRYLPEEVLTFVATALGVSPARVFGVATFYSQFTLEPRGKYVVQICDGTACHVKGSMNLHEALTDHLGLEEGEETTADLLFTVETVSCLGACGLAPVMTVNGEVHGEITPEDAVEIVEAITEKEENDTDE